jgi:hypothetical protein
MSIAGLNEKKRLEMVASTMKEMEALGRRMRNLIAAQPPLDLLGYIYAQHILRDYRKPEETERPKPADDPGALTNERQFLLEYVHAVLASIPAQDDTTFDEAACAELFECASKLKSTTMFHAMVSSTGTENGSFGPYTADIEFHAKSTWILLRGNRRVSSMHSFLRHTTRPCAKPMESARTRLPPAFKTWPIRFGQDSLTR